MNQNAKALTERPETEEEQRARWDAEREQAIAANVASAMEARNPKATEVDGELFRLLLACAHRVGVEVNERIDVGHTVMGLMVLQLLASPRPPVTTRDVASALGCSHSAAKQTLARLERGGSVTRPRDAWDARAKCIVMTETARKAWETAGAPVCAVVRRATSSFTPDDKAKLVELLGRLERDVSHARVMRAWSDEDTERLAPLPVASTLAEEIALRTRERVRRSGVHVR